MHNTNRAICMTAKNTNLAVGEMPLQAANQQRFINTIEQFVKMTDRQARQKA